MPPLAIIVWNWRRLKLQLFFSKALTDIRLLYKTCYKYKNMYFRFFGQSDVACRPRILISRTYTNISVFPQSALSPTEYYREKMYTKNTQFFVKSRFLSIFLFKLYIWLSRLPAKKVENNLSRFFKLKITMKSHHIYSVFKLT